jgi:hypothetical protein
MWDHRHAARGEAECGQRREGLRAFPAETMQVVPTEEEQSRGREGKPRKQLGQEKFWDPVDPACDSEGRSI